MTNYCRRLVQGMGTLLAIQPARRRRFRPPPRTLGDPTARAWEMVAKSMWTAVHQFEKASGVTHERVASTDPTRL